MTTQPKTTRQQSLDNAAQILAEQNGFTSFEAMREERKIPAVYALAGNPFKKEARHG